MVLTDLRLLFKYVHLIASYCNIENRNRSLAIYLIIPNVLCLLKVSSDGLNINLKFLDIVHEERKVA